MKALRTISLCTAGVLFALWFHGASAYAATPILTKIANIDSQYGTDVALGDLDGDGDLDAFVTNSFGEANTVWLNDGKGAFLNSGQQLGNESTWAVSLGDVDGDGDLDAVLAESERGVSVWLNDGSALFTQAQQWDTAYASDIALGDLDSDGDLDIFIANNVNNPNQVWLNSGGKQNGQIGTFTDSGQLLGTLRSHRVLLGDLDSDGDLDAFVANSGDLNGSNDPNKVWLNDGNANFIDSGQTLGPNHSRGAALGDLDGDGDLDVYVINFLERDKVWINNGAGIFSESPQPLDGSPGEGVMLGDLDGDGDLDVYNANRRRSPNQIWLNDGTGTFVDSGLRIGDSDSYAVALGDLDSDGDLDVYVANGASEADTVWRNDSPANFQDSGQALGDRNTWSSSLGDVDGDGDLDAVTGNIGGAPNKIWLNHGRGLYVDSGQELGNATTVGIALGDLNGDGALDIFAANHGPNRVWFNNGTGLFADSGQALGNLTSEAVALGDLDGDGDLDAFVGNGGSLDNTQAAIPDTIWLNDGKGTFTASATLGNSNSEFIALGDLDGDGDLDAYVGNSYDGQTNQNDVWLNDGKANFTKSQSMGDNDSYGVALGDLDSDGDLDAFVANVGGQANIVWLNDGNGHFSKTHGLGSSSSYGVALGDLDGDGDLDAFIANAIRRVNKIWYNDGHAIFTEVASFGDAESITAALGDLDGDGDLDAFVGNCCGPLGNRVWRNDNGYEARKVAVTKPGPTQNANLYSSPVVLARRTISVPYILQDVNGFPVGHVAASFSLNGGANWQPAIPTNENETRNLHTFGSALQFDGVDDYVAIGALDHNFSSGITVEAWVWYDNFNSWSRIIELGNGAGIDNIVLANQAGTNNLVFQIMQDGGRVDLVAPGILERATWFHLAATIDATGVGRLYKNGIEVAAGPLPLPKNALRSQNYFGHSTWSLDGYFAGRLDEVRLWNVARSQADLAQHKAGYLEQGEPGLVANWRFDEGFGRRLLDQVRRNDAILGGGADAQSPSWVLHPSPYFFHWDTFASQLFGQSDNVVVRIEAYPGYIPSGVPDTYHYINRAESPIQWPNANATTFPFRVRGTQILVVNEDGQPQQNAVIYRLPRGRTIDGELMGGTKTPFTTSAQGFLTGRGELQVGDQLIALAPISHTHKYRAYQTSATTINADLVAYEIRQAGVQTLTVSAANPLLLFDITVSLEWNASQDDAFLPQLRENLQNASEALYDWTNGQVALGNVTVYQDKEAWTEADIQILASNQVRPIAHRGGIVTTTTVISLTDVLSFTAIPGNIRMGPTWNRYGNAEFIPGDWPRALAHEFGHYLLYLEDTYMGLHAERGLLVAASSCSGTAMTDPYDDAESEFHFDAQFWAEHCGPQAPQPTLAEVPEWQIMTHLYPDLVMPTATIVGPIAMPFAFTAVDIMPPPASAQPLVNDANVQLDDPAGLLRDGRAYLIRSGERLVDLGRPVGGVVLAYGARLGDEICVFATNHYACAVFENSATVYLLPQVLQPLDIQLTPVNTTTLEIRLISNTANPITVIVYPDDGKPVATVVTTGVAKTVVFDQPIYDVQLGYTGVAGERGITGYTVGGGPARTRSYGGPLTSGDGGASLYPPRGLHADDFMVLQLATRFPQLPTGLTPIGRAYDVRTSADLATFEDGSITFQYLGMDVLLAQADEASLAIYYWNGASWQRLETLLNPTQNFASAAMPGPGRYGLMAGHAAPSIQDVQLHEESGGRDPGGSPYLLTIHGDNFVPPVFITATGDLASYPATVLTMTSQVITASLPAELPADLYDVALEHPGSAQLHLPNAFAVLTKRGATTCFYDDFKSGLTQWEVRGEWGVLLIDTQEAVTDSPNHPYQSAERGTTLTTTLTSQPFSLASCDDPLLVLQHDYEILNGDLLQIELSIDNGLTWHEVVRYEGMTVEAAAQPPADEEWGAVQWQKRTYALSTLDLTDGADAVRVRLQMIVDDTASARGWIINEISIFDRSQIANQLFLPVVFSN